MLSLFLAIITMNHTFSGMLPKLSYLTTLDKIFMLSYILSFSLRLSLSLSLRLMNGFSGLGFLSLLLIDANVTFPQQYGNFSLFFTKTEDRAEKGEFSCKIYRGMRRFY